MQGWLRWFFGGLWKRRRTIRNIVLITLVFSGLTVFLNRSYFIRPDRTIDDPAFVAAANDVCGTRVAELGESKEDAKESNDEGEDDETANARKIQTASDGLAKVVADLRNLKPNAASAAKVDQWLDNWEAFIQVGRDYAAALRAGEPDEYERVAKLGEAPSSAIRTFARANRIDNCNGPA